MPITLAVPPRTRLERAAELVAELHTRADLDRWDRCCLVGLFTLTVGLWVWIGFGVALTVVGGLVLALGVAGAIWDEDAADQASARGG